MANTHTPISHVTVRRIGSEHVPELPFRTLAHNRRLSVRRALNYWKYFARVCAWVEHARGGEGRLLICIADCFCVYQFYMYLDIHNINKLTSMKQLHSVQCHQHTHSHAVNSRDNDLRYSHMGSDITGFVLGASQA